jgi:NAD(P)-dependent dehydrogenase (short-subunit alcohol dehydrogenase family)
MGELDGRVAIVTGAGRGIGRSIAQRFAREGASLIVNDLGGSAGGTGSDRAPIDELVQELAEFGAKVVPDTGDIADVATGERLVEMATSTFGKLDIVVNVAGFLRDRMIFNLSEDDWDAVVRVHLKGHYSTVRPAAAYWREQRNPDGQFRIINFTSISGLDGAPAQANYASAKMGVIGLTYSLAQGLARYGVTANAISPGAATRLTASTRLGDDGEDEVVRLRRSPDNVASVAQYLASERSDWLSGRVIASSGYSVGLYENPRVVSELEATSPWDFDTLASSMERSFKPLAHGLPPSVFVPQGSK